MNESISPHKINILEIQFNDLKINNQQFRQQIDSQTGTLKQIETELQEQISQNENLLNQINNKHEIRIKNDELEFEFQKLEGERNFHKKHHIEAKKTIFAKLNQDNSLSFICRELENQKEENEALRVWIGDLSIHMDEIGAFVARPIETAKNDTESENLYANRVLELEAITANLRDVNAILQLSETKSKTFDTNISSLRVDQTKAIIIENESLSEKIESLRKENLMIHGELEKRKKQRNDDQVEQIINSQEQIMLEKYISEIEKLKLENAKLLKNNEPIIRQFPDNKNFELNKKISVYEKEKKEIEAKIEQLIEKIGFKDREIFECNLEGSDGDAIKKMIDANKKMSTEINRLQEQMIKLESFSRDSMINSFNN